MCTRKTLSFRCFIWISVFSLSLEKKDFPLIYITPVMDWRPIQATVLSTTPTKIKCSLKMNDKCVNKQFGQVD